jgi:hypothetical protein
MQMTENERYELLCGPKLKAIEDGLNNLVKVVTISNGKPSLLSRMDTQEVALQNHVAKETTDTANAANQRSRSFKFGPLEINGYMASDVVKFVLVILFAVSLWFLFSDRSQRNEILNELHLQKQIMKDSNAQAHK